MARQEIINRGKIEPPCNYGSCLPCKNFREVAEKIAKNPEVDLIIGACHSDPITGDSQTQADGYSPFGKWMGIEKIDGKCPDVLSRIKPDSVRES